MSDTGNRGGNHQPESERLTKWADSLPKYPPGEAAFAEFAATWIRSLQAIPPKSQTEWVAALNRLAEEARRNGLAIP